VFMTLLAVTFVISLFVCWLIARAFSRPIRQILDRVAGGDLGMAWVRYVTFAIYVVGVSGGVRIWDLEKYITPREEGVDIVILNADRWVLEIYRTVISTAQAVAWMLLVFFGFALIAFVLLRGSELRHKAASGDS
jgi:hypothetical protein